MKRIKIRENGITVIYENVPGETVVSLLFKTGSYYENASSNGVTYCTARAICRNFFDGGTEMTVEIRRDSALFTVKTNGTTLKSTAEYLFSMFDPLPISEQASKEVIAEIKSEMHKNSSDDEYSDEYIYFGSDEKLLPVYGTYASVSKLNAAKLNKWREKYFQPSNACLTIAGDFPENELNETLAFIKGFNTKKTKSTDVSVFPCEQFFRTSSSDVILASSNGYSRICIMFEVDLCETGIVYADMLRRILAQRLIAGKISLFPEYGELLVYKGFAVIKFTSRHNADDPSNIIRKAADIISEMKNDICESEIKNCESIYNNNMLYKYGDNSELSRQIGLHNFILYTDDIVLPEEYDTEMLIEKLYSAADHILIPDCTIIRIDCPDLSHEPDIRKNLAYMRVKLFI